ncbi:restriction endonuclease subunit S [Rhizobium leguminosarum]|nr:restriction endonuclease subunit S [Rhizobium leguminosarum]
MGDVLTLQRGFDITKAAQVEGSVPVVSSSGINSSHNAAMVEGPGVVIGRKGSLGTCFFLDRAFWPHDTTLWVKDFKGNDPKYCYYLLGGMDLAKHDVGAANPTLNRNHVHLLRVSVPDVDTQRRIASILGAYDDLIEVNQRRIAVLEKMARGLFEEWFVRFRFPGYGEVPVLDTPDGQLPKGWAWGTIGEVSQIIKSGSTPSRKERTYWEDGVLEWFTTGELNNSFLFSANERVSKIAVDANKVRVFPVGTVFIALYGATIGALGVAAVECSSNQAALGLVPDGVRMRRWQLFHTLAHLKDWFISVGQGAAQQNISKEKVAATRVALPPARISELFDRVAAPLWELRSVVERQNSHLSASRDLLLPRLISGQLSVTHAERELERAA